MKRTLLLILSIAVLFTFAACGSSQISGTYTDSNEGSIAFGDNNTFQMFGGYYASSDDENEIWCQGTYALGDDDRTIYFKSVDSSKIKIEDRMLTWTYDKSADVIVAEGGEYLKVVYYKDDNARTTKNNVVFTQSDYDSYNFVDSYFNAEKSDDIKYAMVQIIQQTNYRKDNFYGDGFEWKAIETGDNTYLLTYANSTETLYSADVTITDDRIEWTTEIDTFEPEISSIVLSEELNWIGCKTDNLISAKGPYDETDYYNGGRYIWYQDDNIAYYVDDDSDGYVFGVWFLNNFSEEIMPDITIGSSVDDIEKVLGVNLNPMSYPEEYSDDYLTDSCEYGQYKIWFVFNSSDRTLSDCTFLITDEARENWN